MPLTPPQGYEDRKRHESDKRENARPVMRLCDGQVSSSIKKQNLEPLLKLVEQWQRSTWAQLRVSDLIRIKGGDTFPAGW
jgi:hypothetical protein